VATGFRERSCSNKEIERHDDSTRSHHALGEVAERLKAPHSKFDCGHPKQSREVL
jgi:hypothetical protein